MEGKRVEAGSGKKQTRGALIAAIVAGILILSYIGLCVFAQSGGKIFPNVRIGGQWDVGGMSVEEAAASLAPYEEGREGSVQVTLTGEAGDVARELTYADLGGVTMDARATAQRAYDYCEAGFFSAGYRYVRSLLGGGDVAPVLRAEGLTASRLADMLDQPAVDGDYEVAEAEIRFTVPAQGRRADSAALAEGIAASLAEGGGAVEGTYTVTEGRELDLESIHTAVAREKKNAGYDAATGHITEAVPGVDFDLEEARRAVAGAKPGETVSVAATVEQPTVTAKELKALLFRDVLGTYKTHVGGTSNRISNVKKSAAAINGVVLNSGDVFSYNDTVGKRTAERGYLPAPAYVKGETVDEIGGGICQTSSTLYMATLLSDLEIVDRAAHRYVPAYITKGMDATVSWGGPEFRFANNTDYPIKIVTHYANNYLTVTIYGTNLTGKYVKMTNEVLSTTPFEVVYEDDPTLPAGTEQVKTTPYTGYKVRTYRNVYSADGKLIASNFEASSDYKVRNKVILRGTKPVEIPVEPPVPTEPVTPVEPPVPTEPTNPTEPETPTEPVTPATPEEPELPVMPDMPDEG